MSLCKSLFFLKTVTNWNGEGCAKGHFMALKIIPGCSLLLSLKVLLLTVTAFALSDTLTEVQMCRWSPERTQHGICSGF